MKRLLLTSFATLILAGCAKHDVVKQSPTIASGGSTEDYAKVLAEPGASVWFDKCFTLYQRRNAGPSSKPLVAYRTGNVLTSLYSFQVSVELAKGERVFYRFSPTLKPQDHVIRNGNMVGDHLYSGEDYGVTYLRYHVADVGLVAFAVRGKDDVDDVSNVVVLCDEKSMRVNE